MAVDSSSALAVDRPQQLTGHFSLVGCIHNSHTVEGRKLVNTVARYRGLQGKLELFIENRRISRISIVESESAHQKYTFKLSLERFSTNRKNVDILETSEIIVLHA